MSKEKKKGLKVVLIVSKHFQDSPLPPPVGDLKALLFYRVFCEQKNVVCLEFQVYKKLQCVNIYI